MRINFYAGFDVDRFIDLQSHLRVVRRGRTYIDVIEIGSTQDVEQNAAEVSIEDRLTKLEKDFYSHSHMNNDGDNPCAGEIIFRLPKGAFDSCYDKRAERREQAQIERGL
jgi:hypothetical protein